MFEINRIEENILRIKEEIAHCNRNIRLLCATKTIPAEVINKIAEFGITDIGENRVQELKEKFPLIENRFVWHLIGALQTNKVKYIADKVSMIHSVDRRELADEIDLRCAKINKIMDVLVEVNIGKEPNKSGVFVEKLNELMDYIVTKPNLRLRGLMTVMPIDAEQGLYAEMQNIFEKNKSQYDLEWLSMGMSDDYKTAMNYGANILRIGKAIFGPRNYNGGK